MAELIIGQFLIKGLKQGRAELTLNAQNFRVAKNLVNNTLIEFTVQLRGSFNGNCINAEINKTRTIIRVYKKIDKDCNQSTSAKEQTFYTWNIHTYRKFMNTAISLINGVKKK